MTNGVQSACLEQRMFQLRKEEDRWVDRVRFEVSRTQGGTNCRIDYFTPITSPTVVNTSEAPENRLPWKFSMTNSETVRFVLIKPEPEPVMEEDEIQVPEFHDRRVGLVDYNLHQG